MLGKAVATDPYTPPEAVIEVSDALPVRPVLGVVIAISFNLVATSVFSMLFAFLISDWIGAGASEGGTDAWTRRWAIEYVFLFPALLGLVITFITGYICVLTSRSRLWRYPLIVAVLYTLPIALLPLATDRPLAWSMIAGRAIGFIIILVGAGLARRRIRPNSNVTRS